MTRRGFIVGLTLLHRGPHAAFVKLNRATKGEGFMRVCVISVEAQLEDREPGVFMCLEAGAVHDMLTTCLSFLLQLSSAWSECGSLPITGIGVEPSAARSS